MAFLYTVVGDSLHDIKTTKLRVVTLWMLNKFDFFSLYKNVWEVNMEIIVLQVSPTASFKDDLQLDMLENVEVMMAVEEEFAVDIPDNEANKISTAAHLIDYISTHP